MNLHLDKRLFVVAVLGALAVFAMGFFVALGVRSVVAGPDSAPAAAVPNPGHTYDQIELPAGTWSGLDADTVDGMHVGKAYSNAADIDPIVTCRSGYVWWDYSAKQLKFEGVDGYNNTSQVAGYAEEGTGTAFKHSWVSDGSTWSMAVLTHNGDHASFDITSEGPDAGYIHIFALYSNGKFVAHYSYRYQ